jgi:hypothetical protein
MASSSMTPEPQWSAKVRCFADWPGDLDAALVGMFSSKKKTAALDGGGPHDSQQMIRAARQFK